MTKQPDSSRLETAGRKKSRLPAFCSLAGALILLCVIGAFLPLTIPNLLGYQIYEVVSGSMEPEIPVGSVIYVKEAKPEEIEKGEIIAFMRNSSVITHRVEENRFVEGEFITKGDANSKEDVMPVDYDSLIGRVTCHIPVLGILLSVLASGVGKLYAGGFAACGFMFLMLAEKIRERQEG